MSEKQTFRETVSLAINGKGDVTQQILRSIYALADALDYPPTLKPTTLREPNPERCNQMITTHVCNRTPVVTSYPVRNQRWCNECDKKYQQQLPKSERRPPLI